MFKSVQPLGQE